LRFSRLAHAGAGRGGGQIRWRWTQYYQVRPNGSPPSAGPSGARQGMVGVFRFPGTSFWEPPPNWAGQLDFTKTRRMGKTPTFWPDKFMRGARRGLNQTGFLPCAAWRGRGPRDGVGSPIYPTGGPIGLVMQETAHGRRLGHRCRNCGAPSCSFPASRAQNPTGAVSGEKHQTCSGGGKAVVLVVEFRGGQFFGRGDKVGGPFRPQSRAIGGFFRPPPRGVFDFAGVSRGGGCLNGKTVLVV